MGGHHDYSKDGVRKFFCYYNETKYYMIYNTFIKMINMMKNQQN